MSDDGQRFYWTCNWNGCSVGGSAETQVDADDDKAYHMAWCDKRPDDD